MCHARVSTPRVLELLRRTTDDNCSQSDDVVNAAGTRCRLSAPTPRRVAVDPTTTTSGVATSHVERGGCGERLSRGAIEKTRETGTLRIPVAGARESGREKIIGREKGAA